MMDTLLSIKPKYAEEILTGKKKYEYRRIAPVRPVELVWMYATTPVGKIVGCFILGEVVHETVSYIWENCPCEEQITKDEFFGYFAGVEDGHALEILDTAWCVPPAALPMMRPPQNFMYINKKTEGFFEDLRERLYL